MQTPGAKCAPRERDGLFEMVKNAATMLVLILRERACQKCCANANLRARVSKDEDGPVGCALMLRDASQRPSAVAAPALAVRCDAPQHEGKGAAAHFGQTNPTVILAKRSQQWSSPRKRGPRITGWCSWVPALAALSRDDNRVRSREGPTCGCTKRALAHLLLFPACSLQGTVQLQRVSRSEPAQPASSHTSELMSLTPIIGVPLPCSPCLI
jgi:hypothetical protein